MCLACSKNLSISLAEREGFEPPSPISQGSVFQDRRNRPLCHLSGWQGGRDSNPQPTVLETAALPIELPPCGKSEIQGSKSATESNIKSSRVQDYGPGIRR